MIAKAIKNKNLYRDKRHRAAADARVLVSADATPLTKRRVLRRRSYALKIKPSTGTTSGKGGNIAAIALKICFGLGASL